MSTHLSSVVTGVPRQARVSPRLLRTALGARALWNGGFALYLLLQHERSVKALIAVFVRFAFVDALLAIVVATAYLAVTPRRPLWLSPAVDAAARLTLVALVVFAPGWVDVPLTAVLYVALLATFVVMDGALDLAVGLSLDRELGHRSGWWSLSANGMVAMAAGAAMFALDPGARVLRLLLVVVAASHGAACASAARHVSTLRVTVRRLDARARA